MSPTKEVPLCIVWKGFTLTYIRTSFSEVSFSLYSVKQLTTFHAESAKHEALTGFCLENTWGGGLCYILLQFLHNYSPPPPPININPNAVTPPINLLPINLLCIITLEAKHATPPIYNVYTSTLTPNKHPVIH